MSNKKVKWEPENIDWDDTTICVLCGRADCICEIEQCLCDKPAPECEWPSDECPCPICLSLVKECECNIIIKEE